MMFTCCINASKKNERILVDLTYKTGEDTLVHPLLAKFKIIDTTKSDNPYLMYNTLEMSEHTGTHIDAFSHFIENATSVDGIPVDDFFLNTILIDISAKCEHDHDYALQVSDLQFTKKELSYMRHKQRNLLLIRTGYGKYWGNMEKYLGVSNDSASPLELHFPSIGVEAAQKIVDLKLFTAVGLDVVSLDPGYITDYAAHRALLNGGVLGLENVANLDNLPAHQFFFTYVFPMKLKDGTGAPTRIVAEFKPSNKKQPFKYV